ncbi:MAG TPA: ComEC/Rec2 family competence protein [Anaerolineae bacterium]|nr:ComEC/Rec2 family competence protein [Anaerolineae bacterium]
MGHIVAISGCNFAVLIALVSVPAVRLFGRRRAFPILLLLIVAYTAFVSASASVVRAAIMGARVRTRRVKSSACWVMPSSSRSPRRSPRCRSCGDWRFEIGSRVAGRA